MCGWPQPDRGQIAATHQSKTLRCLGQIAATHQSKTLKRLTFKQP